MKNLLTLIVVALFATATFAQDKKTEKKADTTAPVMAHECYWMKAGALLHCTGDKQEPIKADVKLKNGTTLSPKGMMTTADGTQTKLADGECVSLMGGVGDCEKMHSTVK